MSDSSQETACKNPSDSARQAFQILGATVAAVAGVYADLAKSWWIWLIAAFAALVFSFVWHRRKEKARTRLWLCLFAIAICVAIYGYSEKRAEDLNRDEEEALRSEMGEGVTQAIQAITAVSQRLEPIALESQKNFAMLTQVKMSLAAHEKRRDEVRAEVPKTSEIVAAAIRQVAVAVEMPPRTLSEDVFLRRSAFVSDQLWRALTQVDQATAAASTALSRVEIEQIAFRLKIIEGFALQIPVYLNQNHESLSELSTHQRQPELLLNERCEQTFEASRQTSYSSSLALSGSMDQWMEFEGWTEGELPMVRFASTSMPPPVYGSDKVPADAWQPLAVGARLRGSSIFFQVSNQSWPLDLFFKETYKYSGGGDLVAHRWFQVRCDTEG